MGEPSSAPAEFVSYVDRRLRALESAASRLTGDDGQAERLAEELLTLVALRWGRLSRADARHGLTSGESADGYLVRLLRHEASEYGYPQVKVNLDAAVPGRRRTTLTGAMPFQAVADQVWQAARRRLRRRLLIAGVAGGVIGVGALCRTGASRDEPAAQPPPQAPLVRSTELPVGARLLQTGEFGDFPISGVPDRLKLPEKPPKLTDSPVPRAVLLAGAPDAYGGAFALADDGSWREVDAAPFPAATWIAPTSLSPDGRRAVFVTATTGVIVDLATGKAKPLPGIVAATKPVWLSERQLLVSKGAVLDLETDRFVPVAVSPEDAVTPRSGEAAHRESVTELLSIGRPMTAPARVRNWRLDRPDSRPAETALNGDLVGVIGWWQGAGFGFAGDRVARICRPRNLPETSPVDAIVAVLNPQTGQVIKALLVDNAASGAPTLVGWRDVNSVLLTLAQGDMQVLVSWDVVRDEVWHVSTMDFAATIAVRDLTRA